MTNLFDDVIRRLKDVKIDLPIKLGNTIQRHFRKNFDNEGFDGVKWKEVQRRIESSKSYHKGKASSKNPILIGTGKLRKSLQIKIANWERVVVGVVGDADEYASYVNDERQFIGDDLQLEREIDELIQNNIDRAFGF